MTAPAAARTDLVTPAARTDAGTPARTPRRRPRARLRPVPSTAPPAAGLEDPAPAASLRSTAAESLAGLPADEPLTVTISIGGGAPDNRDRVLAALRELVEAAGAGADVALRAPVVGPAGEPGVINLDPAPRAAFRDGRLLELSRLEYDLLLFFAEHPRQVFTRAQLLARVWGHVHTGARTVDVHISRLRSKLADHELITTVYGIGYRLADAAPLRVV